MSEENKKDLTLWIDAQLIKWTELYAANNQTSVSELVEEFFRDIERIQREMRTHAPILEQLTGIIPAGIDGKQMYGDYLMEKYG